MHFVRDVQDSSQFPMTNGAAFSRICVNGAGQLYQSVTKFLKYLPQISVPFEKLPRSFGWMVCFSEDEKFLDFLELFQVNFCNICPSLKFLGIFGWIESILQTVMRPGHIALNRILSLQSLLTSVIHFVLLKSTKYWRNNWVTTHGLFSLPC